MNKWIIIPLLCIIAFPVFAENIQFKNENGNNITTAYTWQNITIEVTTTPTEQQELTGKLYATVTSNAAPSGIKVPLSPESTTLYSGNFYPNEDRSDNTKNYIKVSSTHNLTVFTNVTAPTTSILPFYSSNDTILTYVENKRALEFNVGDTVKIQISSAKNKQTKTIEIATQHNQSLNLTITEESEFPGLYESTLKLSPNTTSQNKILVHGAENITIMSNISASSTVHRNIKDWTRTYSDANYSSTREYFKSSDHVYVVIENTKATNSTYSIHINSTLDSPGIYINVTKENNSFKGNFSLTETTSSDAQNELRIGNGRAYIYADLDNNNLNPAKRTIYTDISDPHKLTLITPDSQYYESSTARTIKVEITDNIMTARYITLYYWIPFGPGDYSDDGLLQAGEGSPQSMSGIENTTTNYTTTIDDTSARTNDTISLWLSGTDKAGNPIHPVKTGNWSNPLKTYIIDDQDPVLEINKPSSGLYIHSFNISINLTDPISGLDMDNISYTLLNKTTTFIPKTYITSNKCLIINRTQPNQTFSLSASLPKNYITQCNITHIDISTIPFGNMKLVIKSYDHAGNKEKKSIDIHKRNLTQKKTFSFSATYNQTFPIQRNRTKEVPITLKNTGTEALTNISSTVLSPLKYNITEISTLQLHQQKTIYLTIITNKTTPLKNHSTSISLQTTNTSKTLDITAQVLWDNKTILKAQQMYTNLSHLLKKYETHYQQLQKQDHRIESKIITSQRRLNMIEKDIKAKNYNKALAAGKNLQKFVQNLPQQIKKLEHQINIPLYIIITVIIIIVMVLVYLFWPVKSKEPWER